MVFGNTSGSGLGGLKKALRDEGAVSERMRLDHIKAERERVERERNKLSLEDKKKKLEHNKTELSRRTIEARRLTSEIIHSEAMLQSINQEFKMLETHIGQLEAKYNDLVFQMNDRKKKLDQDRDHITQEHHTETHLEQELHAIELKMVREKEVIADLAKDMDTVTVQLSRINNDANRAQADIHHAVSQKQYKAREVDVRKRNVMTLNERKMHELSEMRRLEAENMRLESEIKSLERLAHH